MKKELETIVLKRGEKFNNIFNGSFISSLVKGIKEIAVPLSDLDFVAANALINGTHYEMKKMRPMPFQLIAGYGALMSFKYEVVYGYAVNEFYQLLKYSLTQFIL